MRNAFIDELIKLAKNNVEVALVVGDLGFSVVERFVDEFPDRFVNAGVAEQNMTGLAAGMASEGYHVFTYSIANFPTFRCAEQIRNDIDYHNLPVTVVAVGGGVAYGSLGYSHHAVQDYALLRSMPNMLIAAPGDPMEVRACIRYLLERRGPSYLRLGKAGEPTYHQSMPKVLPGEWLCVKEGLGERVLLTTGATLQIAMNWVSTSEYEDCAVCSMPLWSLQSKKSQVEQVSQYKEVIALEDHLVDGGFGSWLLESLPAGIGLRDRVVLRALDASICGSVGTQSALNSMGGL